MKTILRNSLLATILAIMPVISFGQDLSTLFGSLDSFRIPNGFLMDKAAATFNPAKFSGTLNDSNYVDRPSHALILQAMERADVINRTWPDTYPGDGVPANVVGLTISAYNYSKIKEDAVTTGLITYSNGVLTDAFDNNGTWKNPYQNGCLFAVSASSYRVPSTSTSFTLLLSANSNMTITKLEVDPGDGSGYREFEGITLPVSYSTSGVKEVKVRATTPSGILLSHTLVDVGPAQTPQAEPDDYDRSLTYSTIGRNGETISASLAIKYGSNDNVIRNPFIYVEGFDPKDIGPIMGGTAEYGVNDITDIDPVFKARVDNQHYSCFTAGNGNCDLIYVNWDNSEADIRDNAQLLIQIIDDINIQKHLAQSTSRNIILGHSMGGLIARYALCEMERLNLAHECRAYISHDAPHKGANVPVGILQAANAILFSINNAANGAAVTLRTLFDNQFKIIEKYLHGISARQMLYNYVNRQLSIDHAKYNEFQDSLNTIGLPKGDAGEPYDNIAFCNGGPVDLQNNLYNGDCYLQLNQVSYPFLTSTLLYPLIAPFTSLLGIIIDPAVLFAQGGSFTSANIYIRPYGLNNPTCDVSINYLKGLPFLPLPLLPNGAISYTSNVAGADAHLDYYEGSVYTLSLDETAKILAMIGLGANVGLANCFVFVPTHSALASPGRPNINYSPRNNISTIFNGAYVKQVIRPGESIRHDSNPGHNMLSLANNTISIGHISGPDTCSVASQYYLSGNIPNEGDYSWSVSDFTKAHIDYRTGELVPLSNGIVDVEFTHRDTTNYIHKTKTIVIANQPERFSLDDMYLEYVADSNYVQVRLIDHSKEDQLDSLHMPYMKAEWFVKKDFGMLEQYNYYYTDPNITNPLRFYLGDRTDEAQDNVRVSFRLTPDVYGNEVSPLYVLYIPIYREFSLSFPKFMVYSEDDGVLGYDGTSFLPMTYQSQLIVQSTEPSIRSYLRNNARAVLLFNDHVYPNVSTEDDKLKFNIFEDELFDQLFVNVPPSVSLSVPFKLQVQIWSTIYDDEILQDYEICIVYVQ